MSVILKGFDLPSVLYTDVRIYWDGRIKKIIGENTMISCDEYANAIQIPKDHGTLVEEHYRGELQAKQPMELFIMYRSADEDSNRFIFEAEAEK